MTSLRLTAQFVELIGDNHHNSKEVQFNAFEMQKQSLLLQVVRLSLYNSYTARLNMMVTSFNHTYNK